MDVDLQANEEALAGSRTPGPGTRLLRRKRRFDPVSAWIDPFGDWQAQEVRAARNYPECRGLSTEQLEDIYQETAIALRDRRYDTEEHARHALRHGIKQRALHYHRDERRRQEILDKAMSADMLDEQRDDSSERTTLIREDRLIVAEFLTELTPLEQKVFWLQAEGMRYRSIAKALSVDINTVRKASRSSEPKRERFQLLYDTGRLCHYRARTIHALQNGKATSEELAQQAFAHLDSCASCRAEHRTNAQRLRHTFQGQAAALLLPVPALLHPGWFARLDARLRTLQHRLTPNGLPLTPGGVRERTLVLLAGGGATTKAVAGIVTISVIAGGTVGISHTLERPHKTHPHPRAQGPLLTPAAHETATIPIALTGPAPSGLLAHTHNSISRYAPPAFGPGHVIPYPPKQAVHHAVGQQYEPSGFAYLGVPTRSTPAHNTPSNPPNTAVSRPAHAPITSGGGPFTP